MGDIADEHVARMVDGGIRGHGWGFGGGGPRSKTARCMHCGSTAVAWVHSGVRWRLYDSDMKNPHRCGRVADTNDFEDVSDA